MPSSAALIKAHLYGGLLDAVTTGSRRLNREVDRVGRSSGRSGITHGRRPNAFFQRFFGSSNFTAAGSKASGSKPPPAHRSVDACSSCSGSAMT